MLPDLVHFLSPIASDRHPPYESASELLGGHIWGRGSALLAWRTVLAVVDVLYQAKVPLKIWC